MRSKIATYASGIGLTLAAILVFLQFFKSGQLMAAIVQGVLVPAAVVAEWRRATRTGEDAANAVLRLVPIVALALIGILSAGGE